MSPIGVLCLTIQSAHIVRWNRLLGSAPDPFVSIHINDAAEIARTKHLYHDFEPTWMETKYIVIYSLTGILDLRLYDHHEYRRHTLLGETQFQLSHLEEDMAHGGHNLPLRKGSKQRGDLLVNLAYYPVSKGAGTIPEYAPGIVILHISEARRLAPRGSTADDLSTVAQVSFGYDDAVVHATCRASGTNPVWETTCAFYCPSRAECVIVVRIIDDEDGVVGELSLRLDDLMEGNEWWPLSGCTSGDLRMSASWDVVSAT
ncbi:Tricalbin-3 [Termitomyces sp. T112]|nr:Tricalbin-3 [Termitomyces sp. T112]